MRCPICDYNPDDPTMSIYHSGVQVPYVKDYKINPETNEFSCSCFKEDIQVFEDLDDDCDFGPIDIAGVETKR